VPAIAPRSEELAQLVFFVRGERVILDADLAALYGVTTGALNRAVKRNAERLPGDFMFRLSNEDWENLKSQTGIASSPPRSKAFLALRSQSTAVVAHGGRRGLPYAFTEQGVAMLSSVLRSPRAVEVNIAIMRTFVQLRRLMDSNPSAALASEHRCRNRAAEGTGGGPCISGG
jgi:hypothetical protein